MLHYKCDKCKTPMESPESMVGKYENCPSCNCVNWVKPRKVRKPFSIIIIFIGIVLFCVCLYFVLGHKNEYIPILEGRNSTPLVTSKPQDIVEIPLTEWEVAANQFVVGSRYDRYGNVEFSPDGTLLLDRLKKGLPIGSDISWGVNKAQLPMGLSVLFVNNQRLLKHDQYLQLYKNVLSPKYQQKYAEECYNLAGKLNFNDNRWLDKYQKLNKAGCYSKELFRTAYNFAQAEEFKNKCVIGFLSCLNEETNYHYNQVMNYATQNYNDHVERYNTSRGYRKEWIGTPTFTSPRLETYTYVDAVKMIKWMEFE